MRLEELHHRWPWRPIPNCPGRFILVNQDRHLSFDALLGGKVTVQEFTSGKAKDRVLVLPLDDGGLISYAREDGSVVHTLNTLEGFERKLADLGIVLEDR